MTNAQLVKLGLITLDADDGGWVLTREGQNLLGQLEDIDADAIWRARGAWKAS